MSQNVAQQDDIQFGFGYSAVSSFPWASFACITVGLFMTWFRFDPVLGGGGGGGGDQMRRSLSRALDDSLLDAMLPTSNNAVPQAVLCLTCSHARTHRFLDILSSRIVGAPVVRHVGRVCVNAMESQGILSSRGGLSVLSYARVRMIRKGFIWNSTQSKSLVLSQEDIVLCDETCGRWIGVGGPVFGEALKHNLGDVCGVVLDPKTPLGATLEFDAAENKGDSAEWCVGFVGADDRTRFVAVLATAWSEYMGGISLPIK